jgi:multiple sugar transport system permease protein
VTAAVTAQASTAAPAVTRIRPRGRPRLSGRLLASLILLVLAAAFVIPLLWVIFAAVNGDPSQGVQIMWPHPFTLDNFKAVMTPETTYVPLLNGAILCVGGTLITMVCATLAAYPLSRYRSRLKRPFLVTILFSTGLPITAIMVPVYGLFVQLAIDDSIPATMVFMATTALPISIWLTKNFMDGVPIELEEAAWTDGASPMRGLLRIVMPLMAPGLSVVAIYMGELLRAVHPAPDPGETADVSDDLYLLRPVRAGDLRTARGILVALLAALGAAVPGAESQAGRRVRFRGQRQGLRA